MEFHEVIHDLMQSCRGLNVRMKCCGLVRISFAINGAFLLIPLFHTPAMADFTLQLLHAADQEAGLDAIQDAVNLSAVLNGLEDDFENTLKLSSGDAFIAGAFFNASDEIYGQAGVADILINNALGFEAITIGNHEFDAGPETFAALIEANPEITGPGIGPDGYQGTNFSYISTNLDFSGVVDEDGSPLFNDIVVDAGNAPQPNSISDYVIIDVNGEPIGVVGATTPTLPSIAPIGDVSVTPPNGDGIAALAAEIQADVDALTAAGVNKVVLASHFQQLDVELQVAALLDNVDIVIGGGSNTILANDDDPLRAGDAAAGPYPIEVDSDGETVYVVNTDGNYRYVGQLVVEFDENGIITSVLDESGTFATDDAGVEAIYGVGIDAASVADPTIVEVAQAIADVTLASEANVFGETDVFLNGTRSDVRTQETNLGNLTADANLAIAQEYDSTVSLSIKNGGGIRDDIGNSFIPAGGTTGDVVQTPPTAIEGIKEEGQISQLDIQNSLRFNNGLTLLTVDAQELKHILEYAVAATAPGATPGQFAQVGGMAFSFDADQQAIKFTRDADQTATGIAVEGERIQSLAILDENGEVAEVVVQDGELVGDPNRTFRIVTLSFLADGGDGYPYPLFGEDRVDLENAEPPETNLITFAADGTEQDALAEYLADTFPADDNPATPIFSQVDVSPEADTRIQNFAFREDTVINGATSPEETTLDFDDLNLVSGTIVLYGDNGGILETVETVGAGQ